MIHVIAKVQVVPGKRAEFLAAFHQVVPLVRDEQGCVEYGPTIDAETPIAKQRKAGENAVVVIERWESLDTLQAHLVAEHMVAYREQVKSLVVETQLEIYATA